MCTLFFYWRKIDLCWNQFISSVWLKIRVQKVTMILFNFLLLPPRVSDAYFEQHWFSHSLVSGALALPFLRKAIWTVSGRQGALLWTTEEFCLADLPATSPLTSPASLHYTALLTHSANISFCVITPQCSQSLSPAKWRSLKWPKGHMGV